MDPLHALQGMASRFQAAIPEPGPETIERWQKLFHLPTPRQTILEHRESLEPFTVSDEHWNEVCTKMEARGHDRESYEYSLSPVHRAFAKRRGRPKSSRKEVTGTYLLEVNPGCPPIADVAAVQATAGLPSPPPIPVDDESEHVFVQISGGSKTIIEEHLWDLGLCVQPTFVRLSLPAPKDLDGASKLPMLGVDTILPQHRLSEVDCRPRDLPQQDQYPVHYFFYGTLADPGILRQTRARGSGARDLRKGTCAARSAHDLG